MKIFISHNHRDKEKVRLLTERLKTAGLSVWLDEDSIRPGDSWVDKIQDAIESSDAIIVVISRETSKSQWQSSEIAYAISAKRHQNKKLIPVLIEKDSELPFFVRDILFCDLSSADKFEKNFDNLLRSLKEPTKESSIDQLEHDKKKLDSIQKERELLTQERNSIEQKKAVRMSSILGAFSSILTAMIAFFVYWGGKNESFLPIIKDIAPFVSGVLFGVLGSVIAGYLTHFFQKRTNRKEGKYER